MNKHNRSTQPWDVDPKTKANVYLILAFSTGGLVAAIINYLLSP